MIQAASAVRSCYLLVMLRTRIREKAADADCPTRLLEEVTAPVKAFRGEDLLDLADIFSGDAKSALGKIAFAEMERRTLRL